MADSKWDACAARALVLGMQTSTAKGHRIAIEEAAPRSEAVSTSRVRSVRDDALEIVLARNHLSHLLREFLERPENYLRPVRIRERFTTDDSSQA